MVPQQGPVDGPRTRGSLAATPLMARAWQLGLAELSTWLHRHLRIRRLLGPAAAPSSKSCTAICAHPCPRAPGMSQMVALSQAWAPCPSPRELKLTGKARSHCPSRTAPRTSHFPGHLFPILRPSEASLASCHYQTDCFRAKRSPLLLWPAVSSPRPRAAAPLASGPCRLVGRRVATELRGSKA